MAKPSLFYNPMFHFHTSTGDLANGYQVFFYSPGTTTKKNTYPTSADALAGTNANANPILLNSRGESSSDIYLNGSYKVVLTSNTDTDPPTSAIKTMDNITSLAQTITTVAKSTNYTVLITDADKLITVDATTGSKTITLPAAASAGDGFRLTVKKTDSSANTVVIDGSGAELIDGSATSTLSSQNAAVTLVCNASAWYVENVGNASSSLLTTTVVKSTDYTVLTSDVNKTILVDASGADRTITLVASASAGNGFRLTVKKTDSSSNLVIIDGNAGETIDGRTTHVLTAQYHSVTITCDGSNWHKESISNVTSAATSVNAWNLGQSATGVKVTLEPLGDDTNIGATIRGKGTGDIDIGHTSDHETTIIMEDARTNTQAVALNLTATTTGAPANDIGTAIQFGAESADENPSVLGTFGLKFRDITAGSEDSSATLELRRAGAAASYAWEWANTGTASAGYLNTGAPTANRTITWPNTDISQHIVQVVNVQNGALGTGTTLMPYDDTIPQITEGDQYITLAITPKSTTNILYIMVVINAASSVAQGSLTTALFQDATAGALAAMQNTNSNVVNGTVNTHLIHTMAAGTTSSTTFRVRIGGNSAGTTSYNGAGAARKFGGVMASSITIWEVSP